MVYIICLKMNFKMLFYEVFSLISKDHFTNHISILHYAIKTLFGLFIKFYFKISFIVKIWLLLF
jgi:hypothetical protein